MTCCNSKDPITLEDLDQDTKIIVRKKEGYDCSYCISRESLDSMVENMKSTLMDFTISFADGDNIVRVPVTPEQLKELTSSDVVQNILASALNHGETHSKYINEIVLDIPDVRSKLTLHTCFLHNTFDKMSNKKLKEKLDAKIFTPSYKTNLFGSLFTDAEIDVMKGTPHPSDGVPFGKKLEELIKKDGEICTSHDLAPLFLQYFRPILKMSGNKYNLNACQPPAKDYLKRM